VGAGHQGLRFHRETIAASKAARSRANSNALRAQTPDSDRRVFFGIAPGQIAIPALADSRKALGRKYGVLGPAIRRRCDHARSYSRGDGANGVEAFADTTAPPRQS
jgi:hypothetical protein